MDTRLILALLTVSSALVSCHHASDKSQAEVAETVDVAMPTVENVTLSNVYPGYLTANSSVDVVAKVNGQIVSKNFESGAMVQKGQVLFTIDPSTYLDQVKQAEATLTTANSTRDYAKAHYEAVKKALESDAVSKMEVIQAESAYEQAESSIKSATAALADARRLLGYCTVVAPITGRVADGVYSVGTYVSGQAAPVVVTTVYDNTTVSANFAIEDDIYHDIINSISRQDSLNYNKVPVIFEEPMPHDYTGEISYLAPALNNSTGTLNIKCRIDNPYDELRAGMYVKVDLPYGRLDNAILVNDASIGSDQLGKYLYVVNDSDKVVYTPVTVGPLYHDSLRVIEKGITPKDRYVTKALLKVRDGMTVKPHLVK